MSKIVWSVMSHRRSLPAELVGTQDEVIDEVIKLSCLDLEVEAMTDQIDFYRVTSSGRRKYAILMAEG